MATITITIADEDVPRTYEALSWYFSLAYPDEARQVPDKLSAWCAQMVKRHERFKSAQQSDADWQDGYVPPGIGGEDDLGGGGGSGRSR